MKITKSFVLALIVTMTFLMVSCDDEIEEPATQENIVPDRFTVDIPTVLTNENNPVSTGRVSNGRVAEDELDGNSIYEALGFFIHLAEESATLTEEIIVGISELGIDRALTLSYESDEDGRTKNLVVIEGSSYKGTQYEYELTITDAESEGNEDGGLAMKIFWNTDPVNGVAILKPYNINRIDEDDAGDAMYRIEYDDTDTDAYEATMIVTITGIPLPSALEDPYAIDNLQVFVGKNGDVVDMFGNSNHPNAKFFNDEVGFNWAFSASGNDVLNVGVAEVGLPPNTLESTSREEILVDYSIKQVFTDQILEVWPDLSQDLIDLYLKNTEAPGYFNSEGFIQGGGESPDPAFDPLKERLSTLTPYSPKAVMELEIEVN
mgnify:CR=1 FL=1